MAQLSTYPSSYPGANTPVHHHHRVEAEHPLIASKAVVLHPAHIAADHRLVVTEALHQGDIDLPHLQDVPPLLGDMDVDLTSGIAISIPIVLAHIPGQDPDVLGQDRIRLGRAVVPHHVAVVGTEAEKRRHLRVEEGEGEAQAIRVTPVIVIEVVVGIGAGAGIGDSGRLAKREEV